MNRDNDFSRGERDGHRDGVAGVKPLADTIMRRIYSQAYREGYRAGYTGATLQPGSRSWT